MNISITVLDRWTGSLSYLAAKTGETVLEMLTRKVDQIGYEAENIAKADKVAIIVEESTAAEIDALAAPKIAAKIAREEAAVVK